MAYNKNEILKQAKEQIAKHNLFFIEDIVAFLPCSKETFYKFFPVDSDEMGTIKKLMGENKIKTKTSMRSKWYKSENATLQMGLMKLISTDEERRKLSQTHIDHTTKDEAIQQSVIILPDNGTGKKKK